MPSTSEESLHQSPHPLGPDAPTEDHIPLAIRSVGAGVATASAWMGLVTWGTLLLQGEGAAVTIEQVDPGAAYVNFLLYGLVAALPITGLVSYSLMWPIPTNFRRGGLAMVAVLGGVSLAMLTTFLARQFGGPAGLLILSAISAGVAVWLAREARRLAREFRPQ